MFDQYLRTLKDRLLAPLARALGPWIAPDAITLLAFVTGLACAGALLVHRDGLGLGLWVANRFLDGLDGTQARVHGRESVFGGYLDIVLDHGVYAAIPIAMVVASGSFDLAVAGLLLLASFYGNAASWMYLAAILEQRREGARARGEDTTVTMPPGLVAGTETVVLYSLFFLLPAFRLGLFRLMALLVLVTAVQRLVWAHHHLRT
ncbi:MAG: CDP-alcohol phosphatidyltransferase family protein [Vicinamibacterales bacterium]